MKDVNKSEMEISAVGSLLNPKIAIFYKTNESSTEHATNLNCINEDVTFNWEELKILLLGSGQCLNEIPMFPKTYDEYVCFFERLQPALRMSQATIAQLSSKTSNQLSNWLKKSQWLGHHSQMSVVLQEHLNPSSDTSVLENILFLTASLENGLGNVYYSITNKYPPHLLRDLLNTAELRSVFGPIPILFLKILMGSPDSVNLRNIAWHGFPLPCELPLYYTATLFLSAVSLFAFVEEKGINFQPRLQVTDFSRHLSKIKAGPIDFTFLEDLQRIERTIESSKWTGYSSHKMFWLRIVEHYRNKSLWQFVVLILPQIELVLRRMYGEANGFDITAKLEEYYITMNTIFESNDNHLLTDCNRKGTFHLLYDIFISPYGMRVRDKVSHGEVELNCINEDLCSILLYAGMNLISCDERYPLDRYESKFHLNCLAFECIEFARMSVLDLMSLKTPTSFGMDFNWGQNSIRCLQRFEIIRSSDIFCRPKKEPEIVTMLMRIAQLVVQVSKNYEASFEERFRMFASHELRSRARKTLDNMVMNMNVIGDTLANIVRCLVSLNNFLQTEILEWLNENFADVQRFCKQSLTILENFVRFSDKESNEWIKALDCCSKFEKLNAQFMQT